MPTAASSHKYLPGQGFAARKTAAERFAALNRLVTKHGGWIVSPPEANPVTVECLQGSFVLTELSDAGHDLKPLGEAERIIPGQIVQKFTRTSSGAFAPMTPGSTQPVALTTTHAGITRVLRYEFDF